VGFFVETLVDGEPEALLDDVNMVVVHNLKIKKKQMFPKLNFEF
jgi:hypothetical protein